MEVEIMETIRGKRKLRNKVEVYWSHFDERRKISDYNIYLNKALACLVYTINASLA